MKIFKRIIIFLGIAFLTIAVLLFSLFLVIKNIKAKELIENEIEKQLGISVTIQKLQVSPLLTFIRIEGVTIDNPAGFDESELAYINSINLIWDPLEGIIHKKPTIYMMAVDLARLNVIKNRQGKVNIKELLPIAEASAPHQDETPFYFDILVLSVGEVNYTEYRGHIKKINKFTIGMKDHVFFDLKDEDELIRLVVYKAIQNTEIGKLINLTITPVISNMSDTINSAWGTAKTGVRGVVGIVSLPFKLLFSR